MANATAINEAAARSAAIRNDASECRATAESYSGHEAPIVRALCEQAVFHASRAADRANHDRPFALVHLTYAQEAVAQVLELV